MWWILETEISNCTLQVTTVDMKLYSKPFFLCYCCILSCENCCADLISPLTCMPTWCINLKQKTRYYLDS